MSKLSKAQEGFVDRLLGALEKGNIPWRATWHTPILISYNETSRKSYKGINQLNLFMTAMSNGWDEPRWMTFKQANAAGYKIKKGSVGTDVFHFAIQNKKTKEIVDVKEYKSVNEEDRKDYIIISKSYRVFNGAQIDGLEKLDLKDYEIEYENDKAAVFANTFITNANITLKHGGDSAYYRLSEDFIQLPKQAQFMSERAYYSTLLHECSHATSHETRLNRKISTSFGTTAYAIEELRAELTSTFLTLDMGFGSSSFHEDNHIAYLQDWIKQIKKEPTLIFKSISDAQKIREYILDTGDFAKIYTNDSELQQDDNAQESAALKEKKHEHDKSEIDLNQLKNSISIVEYARDILGFTLVKESRGLFRLEEHDSCKIYPNNTFYRYSLSVGGSIIDFIKHFEQCDTREAIEKMQKYFESYHPDIRFDSSKPTSNQLNTKGISDIVMPEKSGTNKHIYMYLTNSRCIKESVVNEYIKNKILYEDINKNCVFVGKYAGTISYANIITSNAKSKFKQDVSGSVKEVGIYVDNQSDTLVVNEAVLDQMSYMSLSADPHKNSYLSCQGAANVTSALRFHLKKREESQAIKKIVFALDNDSAGETNTYKAIEFLKKNYPNIETQVHIPDGKDFNEHLIKEMAVLSQAAPLDNGVTLQ